jgi:thiamine-monophosphate kinase
MDPGESATLGALGEFGLITAVTDRLEPGAEVRLGPGDDAAVLSVPKGEVVCSLDMLVQDRHFRLDWSSPDDVGHKAAAANLSDLNAMGGRATGLMVGFGAPADLPAGWALKFTEGLVAEAGEVGASLLGGDVSEADRVTIAVAVLGRCDHGVVRRSGAGRGDIVALAGRQGWADAGFSVLTRGFRSPRAVVDAHRRPTPPYDAGPQAAALGATAMIDVSDGLLADLGHIADASGVRIGLDSAALRPGDRLLAAAGSVVSGDLTGRVTRPAGDLALHWVMSGGEDHSLAAMFPAGTRLPPRWTVIGTVAGGHGVVVDGQPWAEPSGWDHFAPSG